jgi:hypothetical protein
MPYNILIIWAIIIKEWLAKKEYIIKLAISCMNAIGVQNEA